MEAIIQQLITAIVQQAVPHVIAAAQQQLASAQPAAFSPAALATAAAAPAATPAPAATGMFGAPAAPAVTPDMVQALITPLVQNEQVKQALMAQMQQMGIANLPDCTPAQLPELYARFQEVEKQAKAAGLIGAPAAAPALI